MKTFRLAFAVALVPAFVLAGCATNPVKLTDSRPIVPGRLLPGYALFSHPVPHGAKLVVIRDAGKLDASVRAEVLVDGHSVANLWSGERVEVYVYAGDHILGVTASPGFFAAPELDHSFNFRPSQTCYFRVGIANRYLDIRPARPLQ